MKEYSRITTESSLENPSVIAQEKDGGVKGGEEVMGSFPAPLLRAHQATSTRDSSNQRVRQSHRVFPEDVNVSSTRHARGAVGIWGG
jgi:hypothetical protein